MVGRSCRACRERSRGGPRTRTPRGATSSGRSRCTDRWERRTRRARLRRVRRVAERRRAGTKRRWSGWSGRFAVIVGRGAGRGSRIPRRSPCRRPCLRRGPERAAGLVERALDLGEALQLPEILSRAWNTKAQTLAPRRPQEARALYQLSLDTALAHELRGGRSGGLMRAAGRCCVPARRLRRVARLLRAVARARPQGGKPSYGVVRPERADPTRSRCSAVWDEALARLAEIPERADRDEGHAIRAR